MPFLSIQARRSARSDSFGDTGRVGSVPGNCMRTPLSSRISLTLGNCAARVSKRSKRHLGTKCAWTSMMSCVTGELAGVRGYSFIQVVLLFIQVERHRQIRASQGFTVSHVTNTIPFARTFVGTAVL